jgi:predicted nucleic acid-binding protein
MPDPPVTYWDSCLFISYIGAGPGASPDILGRLPSLDHLLERARKREIRILTSVVTRVEVAFTEAEKAAHLLTAETVARIEELWSPSSPVEVVELYPHIATRAFELVRASLGKPPLSAQDPPKTLSPMDAIHLATASHLKATDVYTYDPIWPRFAGDIGCSIGPPPEPPADQPSLF